MKKKILLLSTFLLLSLASCGGDISSSSNVASTSSSSDPNTSDVSSDTTSEGESSSSSSKVDEKYAIRITSTSGITITADKESALVGETVTLTVSLDEGFSLIKLLANKKECTKVSDTTYTFIMPNRSVTITCQLSVEGDVTLQGDAAAAFTKEGDIYVARNVSFTAGTGLFKVVIKNGDTSKMISCTEIDRTKCFASISLPSDSKSYTGQLALNTTYDFYYDINNDNGARPLYIKRVGLTSFPNSVDSLYDLFYGRVQSSASVFPSNLTGATYSNTEDDIACTYKVAKDGSSSLAHYSKPSDNSTIGDVYKAKDGEIFKWVDTTSSYNGLAGKSGKALISDYKIRGNGVSTEESDDQEFDETRQYIHSNVVDFEVKDNFEYNLYDLEFDFMEAYRVGLVVEDYIKSAAVEITSTEISGSTNFKTSIVSSKTYDSTGATDDSVEAEQIHYEYRADLEFTSAGEFVSINYTQYTFDDELYNFSTLSFISGDADSNLSKGTVAKRLNVTYEYNQENTIDFDADKYFITSIDSLSINDTNASSDGTGNYLNAGDRLDLGSSYVSMTYSPSTALDSWQYGVTSSSNTDVVYWNESYQTYMGDQIGTSTLTVSNYSDKKVSKTCDVTIAFNYKIRSFWMESTYSGETTVTGDDITAADACIISAGKVNSVKLGSKDNTTGKDCAIAPDLSITCDKDIGLTFSVDAKKAILYMDASSVTIKEVTKVTLTLNTAYYADGITPKTFTVTVNPSAFSSESDVIGRWTSGALVMNVENKNFTYKEKSVYQANFVVGDDTYKAIFDLDLLSGKFSDCHILNSSNAVDSSYTLNMVYESGKGIGVYLCSSSWSGLDESSDTDIIGECDGDEDYPTYTYTYFTKA